MENSLDLLSVGSFWLYTCAKNHELYDEAF